MRECTFVSLLLPSCFLTSSTSAAFSLWTCRCKVGYNLAMAVKLRQKVRFWVARVLVAIVFAWNLQCALAFIFDATSVMGAYQLYGSVGVATLQGVGIAFLMWNATYPAVIVSPDRFRSLFVVILVQQIIGLVGEAWIMMTLGPGTETLAGSIMRFIIFDGAGLVLLMVAFGLTRRMPKETTGKISQGEK